MKEKVSKSQRTGLVMGYTDFVALVFLFMVCGTTLVFAQRKELNGSCQLVGECNIIGYFCARNRTCQCRPGYRPNENWTKCVGFVGSRCLYDSHCTEGAYCTNLDGAEQCKCKGEENFVASEDGETCTNSATRRFHHRFSAFAVLLALLCTNLYLNT